AYNNAYVAAATTQGRLYDTTVQAALAQAAKRPLIVLAHGCNGLTENGKPFASYRRMIDDLARNGFVVLAPEQPGHVNSCPGQSFRGRAPRDDIQSVRRAELRYALNK